MNGLQELMVLSCEIELLISSEQRKTSFESCYFSIAFFVPLVLHHRYRTEIRMKVTQTNTHTHTHTHTFCHTLFPLWYPLLSYDHEAATSLFCCLLLNNTEDRQLSHLIPCIIAWVQAGGANGFAVSFLRDVSSTDVHLYVKQWPCIMKPIS